jgi:Rrf2 family protein
MLSNTCRYGIRAIVYLASHYPEKNNFGIKQISADLGLPTPFLAKILQQLAKNKLIRSTKGPNGGFSFLKNPESITLFDLVMIIDGEGLFKNCIIHDGTCSDVRKSKKSCPVHDDYSIVRNEIIDLFKEKTIGDLVKATKNSEKIFI